MVRPHNTNGEELLGTSDTKYQLDAAVPDGYM